MDEEKNEKGFVIKDRRFFEEDGTAKGGRETETGAGGNAFPAPELASAEEGTGEEAKGECLPEVNFIGFILSLSTTAMFHFGDFPDPTTNESRRNLSAAKQTIDLLSLLKTKTEGNLNADEKQLLDEVLFELRMRYVKEMSL